MTKLDTGLYLTRCVYGVFCRRKCVYGVRVVNVYSQESLYRKVSKSDGLITELLRFYRSHATYRNRVLMLYNIRRPSLE